MSTILPTVLTFLTQNWQWLFWPLVSATLAVLSRKKTAQEWEAWALKSPVLAFLIEVARAAGLDPVKMLSAFKRYADRRAGAIPNEIWERLPVSNALKAHLADPVKRRQLEALAQEFSQIQTPPAT